MIPTMENLLIQIETFLQVIAITLAATGLLGLAYVLYLGIKGDNESSN